MIFLQTNEFVGGWHICPCITTHNITFQSFDFENFMFITSYARYDQSGTVSMFEWVSFESNSGKANGI